MKNQWINENGEVVKSATRPEGKFSPNVPISRYTGRNSYRPYDGITEWEKAANAEMAEETKYAWMRSNSN